MVYNQFRYSVQLNMENQRCVVVGGGNVALRKAASLLKAGAAVTVIAPDILPAIITLQRKFPALTLCQRHYQAGDVIHAFLVVAATDSRTVNEAVVREAAQHHCLVNVADDPEAGNFSVAGTYENGNLLFSVATGGNPRLTHLLLEDLQLPNPQARQEFWRNTLTNQLLQLVKAGRLQQTKEIIIHAVNRIGAEP